MNKQQLAKVVANKLDITNKEGENVIDAVFESILESLEGGADKVDITKVMRFEKKEKKGGIRKNPKTQEEVSVPDKNVIKVKLLKYFKEAQV